MTVEKEKKSEVVELSVKEDKPTLFRMTPDGKITKGHWINKGRAESTGEGNKFELRTERGLFFIKNLDYGWIKTVPLKDQSGIVYDHVTENAQGYDFDNQPYGTIEAALKDAQKWLSSMENKN